MANRPQLVDQYGRPVKRAELTREVRCRMSAQRSCAAEGGEEIDEYTRNHCIANRAWDCIMDQTPRSVDG